MRCRGEGTRYRIYRYEIICGSMQAPTPRQRVFSQSVALRRMSQQQWSI
jgi:hypothetical protein